MSTINRTRLRELVATVGPSARALSLKAGLKETAIKDIISGKSKRPGADMVVAVAQVLGVPLSELMVEPEMGSDSGAADRNLKVAPRFLEVRYRVQAGHWFELDADEPPAQYSHPVVPDQRYSAWPQWLELVVGDSANLKIPGGQYAHVVDACEMGYTAKTGDWVVVERRRDQGGTRERTIKQVEIKPSGEVCLWPRSTNTKWKDAISVTSGARPDEEIEVAIVGLVIGAYNPEF